MITLNLQFFGGRGSAAGKRSESSSAAESKGTGSAVTTATLSSNTEFNRSFTAKDLKVTQRDRYGELMSENEATLQYARNLVKSLNPGDTVKITQNFKDGTSRSTNIQFKGIQEHENPEVLRMNVKRTGDSFGNMDFGNSHNNQYGMEYYEISSLMSMNRSKIKSVDVEVKRKKSKK